MAISADDFTACDLGLDALEPVPLAHEEGNARGLVADVIELQHERIGETAIGTLRGVEKSEHVASCLSPTTIPCGAHLATVQLTAAPDVLGSTLLAPGLRSMKVGRREASATAPAHPCPLQSVTFGRRRFGLEERSSCHGLDSSRPNARRAQRHAEVARDRAHRPAFGSESASFPLLSHLRHGHTNKCSHQGRTLR
jgi:hypothetical protein